MAYCVKIWFTLTITFLVLNLKTVLVQGAPQVPCYFIFGDSLLDNGNNNDLDTTAKANYPPYGVDFRDGPTGRFTNGRNTADFLAELLDFDHYIPPFASAEGSEILEGVNYASGSAGIRNDSGSHLGDRIYLGRQLENHKVTISRVADLLGDKTAAKKHLNKCLFIVGIGSNDYINNYLMPETYPSSHLYTPSEYAAALIEQYSQHLRTLYEDGARKVALFGLGRIGCIPDELQKHNTRRCVGSTNDAIQLFNSNLKSLVDNLNTNFPDAKFTYINMYSISSLIDIFSVLNRPCCEVSKTMPEGQCVPGETPCLLRGIYFFYDNFHPTETANMIATNRAYNSVLPSDAYPMDIRHLIRNNKVYDE
ncbi:PREDICTED: GDSL esterase/lipase At1g29670-like [Nicotiana attenuata]|uniref:Gdsl esteraselipase n=1 Tax=Nicotiana attenuata TaxID=49451 RepID=A0A314L8J2_NICAT|nr:PREDICTED: GDSL esterase/lipase At1g29670-like [Nicotiana attenuata]OIT37872.1 gdsl esteraselipase [Nicotiana attenuata]